MPIAVLAAASDRASPELPASSSALLRGLGALADVAAVIVRGRDPGVEQPLLGRVLAGQLGAGVDGERLVVRAAQPVDEAKAPRRHRVEPLPAAGRSRERPGRVAPVAPDHVCLAAGTLEADAAQLVGQRGGGLGHGARRPGEHEHGRVAVQERGQLLGRVSRDQLRQRVVVAALCLEPLSSPEVQRPDLVVGQRQARLRVLPDEPVEREPARVARQRLEEQAAAGEPVELAGRLRDAGRLEERPAEALEVHRTRQGRPDGVRRRRDDLLREVGEQRALGALEAVEDGFPAARGADRSASIVSRTAAGQPFVALKIRAAASRVASRGRLRRAGAWRRGSRSRRS